MRKIFTLILFSTLHTLLSAQTPQFEWANSANQNSYGFSMGVSNDNLGNIYNIGSSSDTFSIGNTEIYGDFYLSKFDPTGNLIWAKSISQNGSFYVYQITNDSNGNIYFTGFYDSDSLTFGNTTLHNSGNWDAFLVKYDTDGNPLWAKSGIGEGYDDARDLAVDSDNNVYFVGEYESPTINFDGVDLTNNGLDDIFIVKYDSNGTLLWAKSEGTENYESLYSIAIDENNDFYITGGFNGASLDLDTIQINIEASSNMYIAKFNSSGNILWLNSILSDSISGHNESRSVAIDANGQIYVTGYFVGDSLTSNNVLINSIGGGTDFFIFKYSTSGDVIWGKCGGGSMTDVAYNVSSDINNNIYVSGVFTCPTINLDGIILEKGFSHNVFVYKINNLGVTEWGFKLDGANKDDGVYSTSYGNGIILISGNFEGTCDFDPGVNAFNLTVPTDYTNLFVMKITDPELLSISETQNSVLKISPNPTDDYVNITFDSKNQKFSYKLLSISGQIIKEEFELFGDNLELDLNSQNKGMYLLEINLEGKNQIIKIIKN